MFGLTRLVGRQLLTSILGFGVSVPVPAYVVPSILVANVSAAVRQGEYAGAALHLAQFQTQKGDTPEAIEARSWVARGELAQGNLDQAWRDAEETRRLCEAALQGRKLDTVPHLPLALGAALEVEAQVLNRRGQKAEAVQLLQASIKAWHGTSVVPRLQKNLNLMTLVGKPMPPLTSAEWIGKRPAPMATLRGKPMLLFFWAHWCPDCKADGPTVAKLAAEFSSKGLVVIAPTERYGYTPDDEHASEQKEKDYIEKVFNTFYKRIPGVVVPLDHANFEHYGASTTPTFVLVDRAGVVRLYNPGFLDEAALRQAIGPLVTGK